MKTLHFLLVVILIPFTGCVTEDIFWEETANVTEANSNSKANTSYSAISEGQLNAVKKARQMTDLSFTPKGRIDAGNYIYMPNESYTGLIYSSVKELDTYVGSNISFHTFMTAINNPRSVIYTEKIDSYPYHGTNCRAYYGTVCSGLVSYALGIDYVSKDFAKSDVMEEIDYTTPENIEIADVLWTTGHVALITDVQTNDQGLVQQIEISESNQGGTRRYTKSRSAFLNMMGTNFTKVYRYTELFKNVTYTPAQEFVPVLDEIQIPFDYNDDLCVNRGDKSCYLEGDTITINIMHDYEYLEIYKDNSFYKIIDSSEGFDIDMINLPYGDFKARVCYQDESTTGIHSPSLSTRAGDDNCFSDYTYWKVVNVKLSPDKGNNRIFFYSANAVPYRISFRTLSGGHLPHNEYLNRELTNEERSQGFIDIPQEKINISYPYVHLFFSTDYGNIINKPLNWITQ